MFCFLGTGWLGSAGTVFPERTATERKPEEVEDDRVAWLHQLLSFVHAVGISVPFCWVFHGCSALVGSCEVICNKLSIAKV